MVFGFTYYTQLGKGWVISKKEKNFRMVKTLAENNKNRTMTRKVDTYEYQSLADCIRSDQVPASEIAEIFTDKAYYKWYKKRYL